MSAMHRGHSLQQASVPRVLAFALAAALLLASSAHSQLLSLDDLQESNIPDRGRLEHLSCPMGLDHDCLSWPPGLHRYTGAITICVLLHGEHYVYEDALLLITSREEIYFLVRGRTSIGNLTLEVVRAGDRYNCPEMF